MYARVDPGTLLISPQDGRQLHATGPIYRLGGQWVTRLWGTQLGNVYETDPLQGIVQNLPDELGWLRDFLAPWIAILAAVILVVAANAGLIGVSRLAFSLAEHKQLPLIFSRVRPAWPTPYLPVLLFGAAAATWPLFGAASRRWSASTSSGR